MAHPRMYDDSNPALKRLRETCLALPEAFEKEAWGECTFRVTGGSMFAMTDNNHHKSGHVAVWVKAPPMVQEILVKSDGKRFFVPPYMGPKGWVGVRLDYKVKWDEVAAILKDGYLMSAPKRLGGRVPSAMDEAASMSNIATKRRTRSISKVMPTANGKLARSAKPRAKKTSASERLYE
jgi:predicted DNA-binding protein (MmcQ/YjbR family)